MDAPSITNTKWRLASIGAVVGITLLSVALALGFSSEPNKMIHSLFFGGLALIAGLLAQRTWSMNQFKGLSVRAWASHAIVALSVLCLLYAIDVVVGLAFQPDLPFYIAAQKHVGFAATVFVIPIALIPVICALRAWMLSVLED